MDFPFADWLNLIARWVHVFAGMLWVGTTYYFTWLDGQLSREKNPAGKDGTAGKVWMVHSGGFYTVEKQKALGVPPESVHWFRWEAATTWLSGIVLLVVVYYMGGVMVDESVADIALWKANLIGIGALVIGWIVYDLVAKSPLVRAEVAFAIVALVFIALAAYGLSRALSGRAMYMHVGAILGTIMAANVWLRILPNQRRIIAAAARGESFDAARSEQAKLRSKHNTFMAVPVVFLMISSHFPTLTYGRRHGWLVLCGMVLAGWIAAKLIRRA
jgi:uncharacterized membrane protein